jgi:hypothetical protein
MALPGTYHDFYLRREPDGSFSGRDELVASGNGVRVWLSRPTTAVLCGAAEGGERVLSFYRINGHANIVRAGLPWANSLAGVRELACGVEGLDWVDADGNGTPDTCPAGVHAGAIGAQTTLAEPPDDVHPGLFASWTIVDTPFGLTSGGTELTFRPGLATQAQSAYATGVAPRTDVAVDDAGWAPACACADSDGDGWDDCTERLLGSDPADARSFGHDTDGDGVRDGDDRCPTVADPSQLDSDRDGRGDACDPCPAEPDDACDDPDGDWWGTGEDPCPLLGSEVRGADRDADHDTWGDACDVCPLVHDPWQPDRDGDGAGDACDCAPDDAAVGVALPEVTGLRVTRAAAEVRIAWDDERARVPSPARFEVVDGALADLRQPIPFGAATCLADDLDAAALTTPLPAGRWLLVVMTGDCPRGTAGSSTPLPGRADPRRRLDALPPCP